MSDRLGLHSARLVLAAVLNREVSPAELGDLDPDCFCEPVHRWAYAAACKLADSDLSLVGVAEQMRRDGAVGPIGVNLLRLVDETPSVAGTVVRAAAERLIELRRQRALRLVLERVAADLKAGHLDHATACRQLASYAGEAE